MKWFDKLERKYGRYAIQNLMKYIIIVYAVGFVIQIFIRQSMKCTLHWMHRQFSMDRSGEFSPLFTATVYKHSVHCVCTVFLLHDWHSAGTKLGAFKFNVYFFSGVILHVIAAILIYLILATITI